MKGEYIDIFYETLYLSRTFSGKTLYDLVTYGNNRSWKERLTYEVMERQLSI